MMKLLHPLLVGNERADPCIGTQPDGCDRLGLAINNHDPSDGGILKPGHFLVSFLRTPQHGDLASARTFEILANTKIGEQTVFWDEIDTRILKFVLARQLLSC
jgi:hypothetical protein